MSVDSKKALLERMCDWLEEQPEYEGDRLMLLMSDDQFSGLLLHNYGDSQQEVRAVQDVSIVFNAMFCEDCQEFHPGPGAERISPMGGFEI